MPGEVVDSSSLHTTETKSHELGLPLCNALTSNASMLQMMSVQLTLGAASMRHSTRTQGSPRQIEAAPIMGNAFDGGAHPGRRLLMPQHAGTDFPGGKAEAAPTHF